MHKKIHFIIFYLFTSHVANAQFSESPVTDCYFFKNAFVVQKPGTILANTNVIIRKGLITDVGALLKPPFDAKIMNTDSMYIYAGFIDAMSTTGIKKEEKKEERGGGRGDRVRIQGKPSYEQSGVTPQISVISMFNAEDGSITELRKSGFTMSHVIPKGKMLSGMGSVFVLGTATSADKLLIKKDISTAAQIIGGASPNTQIGAIAKLRDVFTNTEYTIKNMQSFQVNPNGMVRPEGSQEISALIPIVKKERPLYFIAERSKDIHRVISLNKQFNYKIVIGGVKDLDEMVPLIKSTATPIVLSLDIPEEIKDDAKKDSTQVKKGMTKEDEKKKEEKPNAASEKKVKDELKKEDSAETKALKARRLEAYKKLLSQAGELEKSGVPFAFACLDVKTKDIKGNLRKFIEHGLSENAALAALTTQAASLLNVSDVAGSVEKGKMANLTITDKPFFDEKSSIKYMVVDGIVYDYTELPKKEGSKSKSKDGMDLNGIWDYTVEVPDDSQSGTLEFADFPDSPSMILKSNKDNIEEKATDITIDGKKVTITMTINMNDQQIAITLNLEFDGKSFAGTVEITGSGTFQIKGDKKSDPKN